MTTRTLLQLIVLLWAGATLAADSTAPTPLLTRSADQWIAVLQSNAGRKEKADACRELAVIGTEKAVPVLASLVADDELGHMALYALETIPGSRVDAALRTQLPRLSGRALIGVIGTLGARRDPRAVKPLTALLRDADPQVAQAAARALGNIGNAAAAKAILAFLKKAPTANKPAVVGAGLQCAERRVAEGKNRDAISIYDRLRAEADLSAQARMAVWRGSILTRGPKQGLGLLNEALGSTDPAVFDAAVRVSMEMPGPEVTRALATSLPRLPAKRQTVVIQALGERRDPEGLAALKATAGGGAEALQVAAVRSMAAIGNPEAVQDLVALLTGATGNFLATIKDGLAGIPGAQADAAALALLRQSDAGRRLVGIELVVRRRMHAAVPDLVKGLSTADTQVRAVALRGVGQLGEAGEVPVLVELLLHTTSATDMDGPAEALKTLCAQIGKPESATDVIVTAMNQAQPPQKVALLGILASIGGTKPLAAVRAARSDPDAGVRDAATRTLVDWNDPAVAPDLLQIARESTEPAQRVVALRAYVRLVSETHSSPEDKVRMLKEAVSIASSPEVKKLVLSGLAETVSVESLRLVTEYVSEAPLAEEAGAAAVKLSDRLDPKYKDDIGLALNRVLKTAKSEAVLAQARKRMEALGIQPATD